MKKTILIVSFGTSHKDAREHSLDCILRDVEELAGENISVYQAYTSGMIINALAEEGVRIPTVEEAVQQILTEGTEELIVVPTHMIPGMEYQKMLHVLEQYRSRFYKLTVTTTVLEHQEDCDALVPVLCDMLEMKMDVEYVLMGHGTEDEANIRYRQMQDAFVKAGITNVHIASVEAKPDIEDALGKLTMVKKKKRVEMVVVQPFMVVAGDHAKNDMAGEEDSYVTMLADAGFHVKAVVKGLGEYPQFREIYLKKVKSVL